jgi:hypothetical protein
MEVSGGVSAKAIMGEDWALVVAEVASKLRALALGRISAEAYSAAVCLHVRVPPPPPLFLLSYVSDAATPRWCAGVPLQSSELRYTCSKACPGSLGLGARVMAPVGIVEARVMAGLGAMAVVDLVALGIPVLDFQLGDGAMRRLAASHTEFQDRVGSVWLLLRSDTWRVRRSAFLSTACWQEPRHMQPESRWNSSGWCCQHRCPPTPPPPGAAQPCTRGSPSGKKWPRPAW